MIYCFPDIYLCPVIGRTRKTLIFYVFEMHRNKTNTQKKEQIFRLLKSMKGNKNSLRKTWHAGRQHGNSTQQKLDLTGI